LKERDSFFFEGKSVRWGAARTTCKRDGGGSFGGKSLGGEGKSWGKKITEGKTPEGSTVSFGKKCEYRGVKGPSLTLKKSLTLEKEKKGLWGKGKVKGGISLKGE